MAEPQLSVDRYFSFVLMMSFAFGVFFEMPLVLLLLGRAGIVNAQMLSRYRRYAICGDCDGRRDHYPDDRCLYTGPPGGPIDDSI